MLSCRSIMQTSQEIFQSTTPEVTRVEKRTNMATLKAYANYGTLAREKKTLYTVSNPSETATYSEEVEITLPEGFEVDENASGEQLVTTPDGNVFLASEVLGSYAGVPSITWYDSEQKLHREKCQVIDADVSEKISNLRKDTGLTQSAFADEYNIPIGTLRDWEQGRRECPGYVIELLKFKIEHE